jgi:nickel transport protein
MKKAFQIALLMLGLGFGSLAGAHSLWFNVDGHGCSVNEPVKIELGWGHKFPKGAEIKEGMLNQVFALAPDGKKIPLKRISNTLFEFVPPQKGVYVISGNVHPGFVSKTTKGYKMGPKSSFEQVLSCFRYDLRGKTYLYAGEPLGMPVKTVGDPLEIIAMENPSGLKRGSDLPVKVLFNGAPLAHAEVHATYAGFSDQSLAFAMTVKTDENGIAKITLSEKGEWFVSATHEIPYPDKKECDTQKYNATLTFDVK